MSDITIKFESDDVIIRGPKSILKIVIDPITVGGIQKITEPVKPVKRHIVKKSKPVVEQPKVKRNKITQEIIDQINYMRDEENLNSSQIAKELKISLVTVNKYYRPKTNEKL